MSLWSNPDVYRDNPITVHSIINPSLIKPQETQNVSTVTKCHSLHTNPLTPPTKHRSPHAVRLLTNNLKKNPEDCMLVMQLQLQIKSQNNDEHYPPQKIPFGW